jgi:hypothetical protein
MRLRISRKNGLRHVELRLGIQLLRVFKEVVEGCEIAASNRSSRIEIGRYIDEFNICRVFFRVINLTL